MRNAAEFFATARERELIRGRRAAGDPPPWTEDPVFQRWRFCNVHRENDKVTTWFRENLRDPFSEPVRTRQINSSIDLVAITVTFRWFNKIETGEIIKDLLWDGVLFNTDEAYDRLKHVHPVVTGAYMILSPPGFTKLAGVLHNIRGAMERLPSLYGDGWASLQDGWRRLQAIPCMGPFMAYEVVSDLRWTPVLEHAPDVMTWSNAGPGCARGLGWVVDGDPRMFNRNSHADQEEMLGYMWTLLEMSRDEANWPRYFQPWELREVEHWLCEVWKISQARSGVRLKRRFA